MIAVTPEGIMKEYTITGHTITTSGGHTVNIHALRAMILSYVLNPNPDDFEMVAWMSGTAIFALDAETRERGILERDLFFFNDAEETYRVVLLRRLDKINSLYPEGNDD